MASRRQSKGKTRGNVDLMPGYHGEDRASGGHQAAIRQEGSWPGLGPARHQGTGGGFDGRGQQGQTLQTHFDSSVGTGAQVGSSQMPNVSDPRSAFLQYPALGHEKQQLYQNPSFQPQQQQSPQFQFQQQNPQLQLQAQTQLQSYQDAQHLQQQQQLQQQQYQHAQQHRHQQTVMQSNYRQQATPQQYQKSGNFHEQSRTEYPSRGDGGNTWEMSRYSLEQDQPMEYGKSLEKPGAAGEGDFHSRNVPSTGYGQHETRHSGKRGDHHTTGKQEQGSSSSRNHGDRHDVSPPKGRGAQSRGKSSSESHGRHQDSTRHKPHADDYSRQRAPDDDVDANQYAYRQDGDHKKSGGSRSRSDARGASQDKAAPTFGIRSARIVEVYNRSQKGLGVTVKTEASKSSRHVKAGGVRMPSPGYGDSYVEESSAALFAEPARRVELYEKEKPPTSSGYKNRPASDRYEDPFGTVEKTRYADYDGRSADSRNKQSGSRYKRAEGSAAGLTGFGTSTVHYEASAEPPSKKSRTVAKPPYQKGEPGRDDRSQRSRDLPYSKPQNAATSTQVEDIKKKIDLIHKSLSADNPDKGALSQLSKIHDMLGKLQDQVGGGGQGSGVGEKRPQGSRHPRDPRQGGRDRVGYASAQGTSGRERVSELDAVPLGEPGRELEAALSMRQYIETRMSAGDTDRALASQYKEIYDGLAQQIGQIEAHGHSRGKPSHRRTQTTTAADYDCAAPEVQTDLRDQTSMREYSQGDPKLNPAFGPEDPSFTREYGRSDQEFRRVYGLDDPDTLDYRRDSYDRRDKTGSGNPAFGPADPSFTREYGRSDQEFRRVYGLDDPDTLDYRRDSYDRRDKTSSGTQAAESSKTTPYPESSRKGTEKLEKTSRDHGYKSVARDEGSASSNMKQLTGTSSRQTISPTPGREEETRRRRQRRNTTRNQHGVLCYVCDENYENVTAYVDHLQGSLHRKNLETSKHRRRSEEDISGTALGRGTTADAVNLPETPAVEHTGSGRPLTDDLTLPSLTIQERLRSIFSFQDDDRFCLVCNQAVSNNVTLAVHCGRQRHQIMQALLDEIAELNCIIEDFAKPDKIQDAIRRAEKIEHKLGQSKSSASNKYCAICSVHVKDVESESLEPHLTGVRHERVKQMCEIIVMVKNAIENNNLKQIRWHIEDYEQMLNYRPSDDKVWLCMICKIKNTDQKIDYLHFETSHHITEKICMLTILKSLKVVYNARPVCPVKPGGTSRSSRGQRSSERGQEAAASTASGGGYGADVVDPDDGTMEEELDYDESMLVALDEIGNELYENEEDPPLYHQPESYQKDERRREEKAPPERSRNEDPYRYRQPEGGYRKDERRREEKSSSRDRNVRKDHDDDRRKEKKDDRSSKSRSKSYKDEDLSKGYAGEVVGKSFVKPGFYCSLCNVYYGDVEEAFNVHCMTRAHCRRVRFVANDSRRQRQRPR